MSIINSKEHHSDQKIGYTHSFESTKIECVIRHGTLSRTVYINLFYPTSSSSSNEC